MSRDRILGVTMVIISLIVIIAYGYIMFLTPYWESLLRITNFLIILLLFGILGWIGYTLATTPPPKPVEEIEKELEEAMKEAEKQQSSEK